MPLDFSFSSNVSDQDFFNDIVSLETLDSIAYNVQIEINSVLNSLPPELGLLSSFEILERIDDECLSLKIRQLFASERIVYKLMWLLHFSTMLKRALVLTSNTQADFLWEVLRLLADLECLDIPLWSPRAFLGEDISQGVHRILLPVQESFCLLPIQKHIEIHQTLCKKINALRSITEGFLIGLLSGDKKTIEKTENQEFFWISALTAILHPFLADRSLLVESLDFLLNHALELELWNLADLLSQSLLSV